MVSSPPRRLPRGRHALAPEEVARRQRERLMLAMAQAMSDKGFAATSVEDVLKRAAVSRQSFYRLFSSKLDCFLAAFDEAARLLEERLIAAVGKTGDPLERFERGITAYLEMLAAEPAYSRLFLIEGYAAGPQAIERRLAFQQRLTDLLAEVLDVRTEGGRFACRAVVAATATLVTGPLLTGDAAALRAVGEEIVAHVRRLRAGGVL
ncbi:MULTISPECIES: TetR/AcrR family transcriptional regulator [Thermomonospora]|uniref:Transcriptional regulator, TetR family n=1 Tax=Thermomonospora curvata (strain ATCC 19995 / DSM 43183 / JCM 3096 / KCTC 9072 / NBRC 15933 / NCIMB 10081 / Henssen B9) TaxID=471852 RepID=D1A1K0_THECD|nr:MULTISPECIES: TetR/AcrR family transcriptional regulator [Thermomonospora]ACY95922.1 transcriptional regulator, TetR family [Thermomonospora curvata DSM 43183]PKK16166.1 MAG: TetR/AcrR family transcriptional regulator [Thermomonospora sp. CIF 1]